MNLKKILGSKIQDSNPLQQAAMNALVRGKAVVNNHNITKEGNQLFIDGKKVLDLPENGIEALKLVLNQLKKLD